MIIRLYLIAATLIASIMYCNAQSSISFNTEYSVGELSSQEDFESCYNIQLDYNLKLKEWMTWKLGLYGQVENFISGGTYSSAGDVFINGELKEDVA